LSYTSIEISILTTFLLHLFIYIFQIDNFLKITNLLYFFIEGKSIITSIVDKRLRSIVVKKSTNYIIQQALFFESQLYFAK